VPTHKDNLPFVGEHNVATHQLAIPNYEVFVVPANYTDDALNFPLFDAATIDSYLNQTQRKRMSVFPDRPRTYKTTNPKVVKYVGPIAKTGGTSTQAMGQPYYLSCSAPALGQADEREVEHFGYRLLIRRVDGLTMSASTTQTMGFRVHHQVHFQCRKVQ